MAKDKSNEEQKSNSDSTKALGGVLVLVAAITGIYAMVRPELTSMQQTQTFSQETQKTALVRVDEKMSKIEQKIDDTASKLNDVEKVLMQKSEKFAEVETQFRKEEEIRKTLIDMLLKKTDELTGDMKDHHKQDTELDATTRTKVEGIEKTIAEIKESVEKSTDRQLDFRTKLSVISVENLQKEISDLRGDINRIIDRQVDLRTKLGTQQPSINK